MVVSDQGNDKISRCLCLLLLHLSTPISMLMKDKVSVDLLYNPIAFPRAKVKKELKVNVKRGKESLRSSDQFLGLSWGSQLHCWLQKERTMAEMFVGENNSAPHLTILRKDHPDDTSAP